MSALLEGSDIGTIKLIEHIVIDKVGVYAYPLEDASRRLTSEGKVSFCNAVIVDVRPERRTKQISVQTPYKLVNNSALPLIFKVRVECT